VARDCRIVSLGPGLEPRVPESAYIDPGARIMGAVTLGEDVVVLFGSVVRGDDDTVTIGDGSAVLENSLIEAPRGHPVVIGRRVLISHGAIVHGAKIGDGALVGIGAIVLDGARVGEQAIVGAGAVVPPGREIPPRTLALGVPAKPVRELTPEELARIEEELDAVHAKKGLYRRSCP